MHTFNHYKRGFFWALTIALLTGCHGMFGGVFDDPADISASENTVYIDASSWADWYYIDFDNPKAEKEAYPIPTSLSGDWDGKSEMVTNLYDVFDKGLSVYEKTSSLPIDSQLGPDRWHIAVHRDNVRTNGGAALATDYQSIDDLPSDLSQLSGYEVDVFDNHCVWTIQDNMVNGYVGCQAIEINYVLSDWLRFDIPPIPPSFTYNGRVFLLRLADGRLMALRLADYQSSAGVKCCLTIEYRFL